MRRTRRERGERFKGSGVCVAFTTRPTPLRRRENAISASFVQSRKGGVGANVLTDSATLDHCVFSSPIPSALARRTPLGKSPDTSLDCVHASVCVHRSDYFAALTTGCMDYLPFPPPSIVNELTDHSYCE